MPIQPTILLALFRSPFAAEDEIDVEENDQKKSLCLIKKLEGPADSINEFDSFPLTVSAEKVDDLNFNMQTHIDSILQAKR